MWKDTVPVPGQPAWFHRASQKETSIDGWLSSLETAFLKQAWRGCDRPGAGLAGTRSGSGRC